MNFIDEYIADIKHSCEKLKINSGDTVVYRGHSDSSYEIKPALLRDTNKNIKVWEAEIFRDIEIVKPYDFPRSMTTLDKLVLMQHYGLPTRLFDVTFNVLVSLYFAVTASQKPDAKDALNGAVLIFKIPQKLEKSFDNDTVACLANLSKLTFQEKQFLQKGETGSHAQKEELKNYQEFLQALYYNDLEKIFYESKKSNLDEELKKLTIEVINEHSEKTKTPITDEWLTKIKAEYFRVLYENSGTLFKNHASRLLQLIRNEKPYFQSEILPSDLYKILFVKVRQENQRIAAQKGAFLLFGLEDNLENIPDFDDVQKENLTKIEYEKIIIPAGRKKNFRDELSLMGINKQSLFPELEYAIEEIVNNYRMKTHSRPSE